MRRGDGGSVIPKDVEWDSVAVVISLDDTKTPWKYIGAELPSP